MVFRVTNKGGESGFKFFRESEEDDVALGEERI